MGTSEVQKSFQFEPISPELGSKKTLGSKSINNKNQDIETTVSKTLNNDYTQ
jgi:hypothetical protein